MASKSGANRVVALGSLNMDLIVRAEHLPAPGETVLGGRFASAPGGKGANQAVAASRLGASVSMVGCVGDDDYGRQLLRGAAADGVDVRHVRIGREPTGVALIVVDALGQNLIAVAQGANGEMSPATVEGAAELIRGADALVAQLETPLDAITAAARIAGSAGVSFILNAAPARSDLGELLLLVTVLVVNETELAIASGGGVVEGREAEAARALLARGPEAVVVTLGARGSVLVASDRTVAVPSYPVQVVDSTAAGDAFVGALAAQYAGLDQLEAAIRYASAAGALACTRPGAQPSLPTSEEVLQLLSQS